jgi:hypothetical protein
MRLPSYACCESWNALSGRKPLEGPFSLMIYPVLLLASSFLAARPNIDCRYPITKGAIPKTLSPDSVADLLSILASVRVLKQR